MTFELMSNGTLAELPPFTPEGISAPDGPCVIALLPHNMYLLGSADGTGFYENWTVMRPGSEPQAVHLYDNESLKINQTQDDYELPPIILPANAVNQLKNNLLSQMTPPGDHLPTVMILRQLMHDNQIFYGDFLLQNEQEFINNMEQTGDEFLIKAYWTLRFALARKEFDVTNRLRAWVKADPALLEKFKDQIKIWFSLQETPDENITAELEELGFPDLVVKRIIAQNTVPLIIYNPPTGYLILTKPGNDNSSNFYIWAFMPQDLWDELRERKKLLIQDIALALWASLDADKALEERARYIKH